MEESKTYHESQKRAIKNYIENNRDKYNEYIRTKHKEKMENDPEYRKKRQDKLRENYLKRKEKKLEENK
jgi:hypothetical protein